MTIKDQEISIIGAGIGGLASAIALARKGAKVRVFEQADELGEVGAGLQIGPNGVAVLEALGLREAAAPLANVPGAVVLRDYRGAVVTRLEMGAAAEARYGRPYWQFYLSRRQPGGDRNRAAVHGRGRTGPEGSRPIRYIAAPVRRGLRARSRDRDRGGDHRRADPHGDPR